LQEEMVMAMSAMKREDPTPKFLFSVRDVVNGKDIGQFSKVTGGEMTVSMVSYNHLLEHGGSVTRYFPGHTTYAPIKLSRPMDRDCKYIYERLRDSVSGKIAVTRTNFSITMLEFEPGSTAKCRDKIIWNLYNALPTAVSGFNFDQQAGTEYASFEVTFQADNIEVQFL